MSVLCACLSGFSARVCRSRSLWVQASKAWPTILPLLQFMLGIACELHLELQLQSRYKTRYVPAWYASCVAVQQKLHVQFEHKAIAFASSSIANLIINCPSVGPSHNFIHGAYTGDVIEMLCISCKALSEKRLCGLKTKLCTSFITELQHIYVYLKKNIYIILYINIHKYIYIYISILFIFYIIFIFDFVHRSFNIYIQW